MPRGSEPGERRGGRQRATPNKRTVLTDRILAVASAHPSAARHEVLTILVKDPALPADIRIAVARQSLPARASRSTKALAARSYARSSSTGMAPDARGDVASQGSHKPAHSPAPVTLDVLFSVAQDVTTIPARRRKSGIGGSAAFPAENSCQRMARRCRWWVRFCHQPENGNRIPRQHIAIAKSVLERRVNNSRDGEKGGQAAGTYKNDPAKAGVPVPCTLRHQAISKRPRTGAGNS